MTLVKVCGVTSMADAELALAAGADIDVDDLPDDVRHLARCKGSKSSLHERECAYVRAVVARHQGDRRQAARELGVSRATVARRLRGR